MASKWFFACMGTSMNGKIVFSWKGLIANIANKGFVTNMCQYVPFHVVGIFHNLEAMWTFSTASNAISWPNLLQLKKQDINLILKLINFVLRFLGTGFA